MAYVYPDFKTKKAVKDALAKGANITVYQEGGYGGVPSNGSVCIEGPHGRHTWYGEAVMKDGKLVRVR